MLYTTNGLSDIRDKNIVQGHASGKTKIDFTISGI